MQNADMINLGVSVAAVIVNIAMIVVTAIMAAKTHDISKANRETVEIMKTQFEASTRPYIQITPVIRPATTVVELNIKNTGNTSAIDLRLLLDRDFFLNAQDGALNNLRNYTVFSKEIQMFAPRAELKFMLGVGHMIFSSPSLCPPQFEITANYRYENKNVSERMIIDLEPFRKANASSDPLIEHLDKLVAELKTINQTLQKAAS